MVRVFKVLDEQDLPQVKCKHCRKCYKHPCLFKGTQGTTSSMSRHLERDCIKYKNKKSGASSSQASSTANSNISGLFERQNVKNSNTEAINENDVKDAVLDYFISGNIAFNQADNPHFQKLVNMIKINGRQVTINRRNIRERLKVHAEIARRDLKDTLAANDSKVSLALDCWTSRVNHAYIGIFLVAYK